jgi:flagellar biosynthesis/type III secretory pathway protein FliH
MSDWDYGRENGLWGNDGIPYVVKYASSSSRSYNAAASKQNLKTKSYNSSEQRAHDCGFKAVYEEGAYNGRYFVKDGKKWIHNLKALKSTMNVSSEYQLKQMGYDVDAYRKYNM